MKSKLLLLISLIIAPALSAEETTNTPDLVLRGILDLGSSQTFSLSTPGGSENAWVEMGKAFGDYTLKSYDRETQTLTLVNNGVESQIQVTGAVDQSVAGATGTMEERLAEAQRIMDAFDFSELITKSLDAQVEATETMMRQQMAQSATGVDEELITFQTKATREMFDDIDWEPIEDGMATAYAEVFTKDELRGVVDFYATPAGKASIEKQPEIQKKTMEVMMPAIMEASQKMQAKLVEFHQTRAQTETPEAGPEK